MSVTLYYPIQSNFASATLSLLLVLLWSFAPADAAEDRSKISYLGKAEGYTVKIRTRVKSPPMSDNKGSHSGAGFLIDAEKGWIPPKGY